MTGTNQVDGVFEQTIERAPFLGASLLRQSSTTSAEAMSLPAWWRRLRERPGAIALHCGDIALTNEELRRRASALADRIRLIAGPEPDIALVIGRGHDLVVAIVAAARTGGRCTVLSPSMWRRDLVAATAGKVVVTERGLAAAFPPAQTICVDGDLLDADDTVCGDDDRAKANARSPISSRDAPGFRRRSASPASPGSRWVRVAPLSSTPPRASTAAMPHMSIMARIGS